MRNVSRLTVITLLVATPALARQDAPATKPAEVTLAVHAVRMTRA